MTQDNQPSNTEADFSNEDALLATDPHLYVTYKASGKSLNEFAASRNQKTKEPPKTDYPNLLEFGSGKGKNGHFVSGKGFSH